MFLLHVYVHPQIYINQQTLFVQSGMRVGIVGIERSIEKKQQQTGREVSQVNLVALLLLQPISL